MDPTFNIWDELKQYADKYAESDRPLPTDEECAQWLRSLLRRSDKELPEDAFDFYSTELCAMIEDRRNEKAS